MSSSAISGIGRIVQAPLNLASTAVQASTKPQAATEPAIPAAASNAVQPILMVPTKPPLSAAVMAELIGRQVSPYGFPLADYAGYQTPGNGPATTTIDQQNPPPGAQ